MPAALATIWAAARAVWQKPCTQAVYTKYFSYFLPFAAPDGVHAVDHGGQAAVSQAHLDFCTGRGCFHRAHKAAASAYQSVTARKRHEGIARFKGSPKHIQAALMLRHMIFGRALQALDGMIQGALPVMGYNYGARNRRRLMGAYRITLQLQRLAPQITEQALQAKAAGLSQRMVARRRCIGTFCHGRFFGFGVVMPVQRRNRRHRRCLARSFQQVANKSLFQRGCTALLHQLGRRVALAELGQAVAHASSLRIARFPVSNEFGDWDTVHNTFSSCNALHQAILTVVNGGAMINPDIATKVFKKFSQMATSNYAIQVDDRNAAEISNREMRVIQQVGFGLSNKEIAQKLFLSEGTVRNYLSNILSKLDLRDRTQLAIWAVQTGQTTRDLGDADD